MNPFLLIDLFDYSYCLLLKNLSTEYYLTVIHQNLTEFWNSNLCY